MKIEKLTENKIRIIINSSDFKTEHIDIHVLMTKALEGQTFFIDLLEKAKKEVGFDTDGCKLLIEAFSSHDDILVFTITKYAIPEKTKSSSSNKKCLTVKRKNLDFSNKQMIYQFNTFDTFCHFCEYIYHHHKFNIQKFAKDVSLYLYQDTYYLIVKNIDLNYKYAKAFYSMASEFSTSVRFSNTFEYKLLEHGKAIMKKNAINTGIKYFVLNKEV